jgi:hypothetical protein
MHKIFFSAFFATKFTYEKFKILSAVFTFHIHDIVPGRLVDINDNKSNNSTSLNPEFFAERFELNDDIK